jgi:capsular polysaccharide transport system ATP-binding protein
VTISFTNVHKTLRRKTSRTKVLDGADAEFAGDRLTGILAPPGSGKTTIANLTTGKLRADTGRVRRSSLVSFPVASGGVFNGALTGRENLAFLCRVFGFDPVPIIRFVVDFTEIGKAIDKPFKDLNRDERTKLLFTSCYAIPFETYIIDESLIGGRGSFRARCEELVLERMQSAGFLILTSSPNLVKRYCNDIFIVDNFKILEMNSVEEAQVWFGADRLRDGNGEIELVGESEENDVLNPRG